MPWHKKPMKDVVVCEKSRGGDKQPLIREYPNGATPSTLVEEFPIFPLAINKWDAVLIK